MTFHSKRQLKERIEDKFASELGISTNIAEDKDFYSAVAMVLRDMLQEQYLHFLSRFSSEGKKRVYYLSMEFLMGRSLKTNLYNMGLVDTVREVLDDYQVTLENLYECEPDAGLGNGGLGRLAACYLDAMATGEYPAGGYSICYEFGIFKQQIVDGWQNELPDNWLPGGGVWLRPVRDRAVEVRFGGELEERWDHGFHHINHVNYTSVTAVPYDMLVPGFDCGGVAQLRLWRAQSPAFDMEKFNSGDYVNAMGQNSIAQAISKVLYPNDNHSEGKLLRLRQQYFLCCASINDIVTRHMSTYGTLDNFHEKVAIHINDTHPTLSIPELMRILLDDCGYSWEKAWHITSNTFSYTNHTVLPEALEQWNEGMFSILLPRIYQIIKEIDNRFRRDVYDYFGNEEKVQEMAIVKNNSIHMASLCVAVSHKVNGVSGLHSQILKDSVFHSFYVMYPYKFTNVTNGIAYRRWLYQSNPALTDLLKDLIGDRFLKESSQLEQLRKFADDDNVLQALADVKRHNKENFANYVKKVTGATVDPDTIFDVQVKRLHEYKRQHLNALNILADYITLTENPNADFVPKTYFFAAKAAPGYFLAKQIIKLICTLSAEISKHPDIRSKLNVVFMEDYRVTLAELLIPASEISEQISLAGTEASGTGNMKLMLNGAVTLGTYDGANIEIAQAAGKENIFIFGMDAEEVDRRKAEGYHPVRLYESDPLIKTLLDRLDQGINGEHFAELVRVLKQDDAYMALADFHSYRDAQKLVSETYADSRRFAQMSLHNIAGSGVFSADRAIREYAHDIWHLR